MSTHRTTEKLTRPRAVWWIVLVALWFSAMPLLSHSLAMAGGPGDGRLEICTTQGPQTVAPDNAHATDSPNGQESGSVQKHCPFCLHPADRYAPPPHPNPYLFTVQSGYQVPVAWQAFFYPDKHLLWARPRGPPSALSA